MLDANQETIRTVLERRKAYAMALPAHVDFSHFFQRGLVDGVDMASIEVGTLQVPSGQIVLADPFYFPAEFTHPFRCQVPPGDYPVVLALAGLGAWGNRVAFARLQLSSSAVLTWELAETTDQGELNVFFGVDCGMACIADAAAASLFARVLRDFEATDPTRNYYDDILVRDIPTDANWGEHRPDPASPVSVNIFSSGLGDGLYSAYWGLDAAGNPAELVVDFQLFDEQGSIFRQT